MLPNPPDSEQLLDQARQGDVAAVDRLLALHREPLRRMIALRLDPALAGRLEAAIASLEDNDRDLIVMKLHENLSNQEVATILGLSEAAASMRYLRAVRRLRAVLLPDDGSQSGSQ